MQELDQNNELTAEHQFGFKPGLRTQQQITKLVTDTVINYKQNRYTPLLLLDLKNAFDKVWHEGLIFKLIHLHIDVRIIKLIHSYLTDRTFEVKINNTHSNMKTISAGGH